MTLEYNKKNWHYRLARIGGVETDFNNEIDLCQYVRAVVFGLLVCVICVVCASGILYAEGCLLASIAASITVGTFFISDPAFFGAMADAFVLCLALAYVINIYLDKRKTKRREYNKPDSFVVNAYKGWKEKYCMRVRIVSND